MDKTVRVVIMVVALIGILSAAFGFAAEGTRLKKSGKNLAGNCRYPNTPARAFAITAAVLLLIAQVTVHAFAGCVCCNIRAGASCGRLTAAWILLFLSWIFFAGAGFMLVIAVPLNTPSFLYGLDICDGAPAGWSAGAAAGVLVSVFLGIGYYCLMVSLRKPTIR